MLILATKIAIKKRWLNMKSSSEEAARKLIAELSDKGKIIEGGWEGFRLLVINKDAPQIQIEEMRAAFFAGAQHLFASIMNFLETGEEPTDQDMRRMAFIQYELSAFAANFQEKFFSYGKSGRA